LESARKEKRCIDLIHGGCEDENDEEGGLRLVLERSADGLELILLSFFQFELIN
jgi:hypothetical protein